MAAWTRRRIMPDLAAYASIDAVESRAFLHRLPVATKVNEKLRADTFVVGFSGQQAACRTATFTSEGGNAVHLLAVAATTARAWMAKSANDVDFLWCW